MTWMLFVKFFTEKFFSTTGRGFAELTERDIGRDDFNYWRMKWCRHEESNPGPTDYKSVALPTELCRHWLALVF